jgi:hypothetical protein
VDPALRQRLDQVGGGEHAAGGHHLAQVPPVVKFARHSALLPALRCVVVERWTQGLTQRGVHEIARHVGVDGRGSIAAMPNGLLNKPPINPVLGQVRHAGYLYFF